MLEFEPLQLDMKPLFDSYVKPGEYMHADASFANLYVWQEAWDIRIAVAGNALFRHMDSEIYKPFMIPPFLKDKEESIAPYIHMCEEYMTKKWGVFYIKSALPETVEKIKHDCGKRYMFEYDGYNSEYVYLAEDLINLPGKKYHSKRNHINVFLRNYNSVFEPYEDKYRQECLDLQAEWAKSKNNGNPREDAEEMLSIQKTLDHWRELGLKGCVVKIAGKVAAFSFGERLNKETAFIHIEKAKPGISGLFTYVNQAFVENMWSDCKYINRAEDMGVEGIRKAKQSYHPVMMLENYDVLLSGEE